MNKVLFIIPSLLLIFACKNASLPIVYESDTLRIEQLTENSYVHISFLDIPDYGRFACNGLVYTDSGEALVFDTPSVDGVAEELINWIQKDRELKLTGVVVNHFHDDCLGGLSAFHENGIPSYSNIKTIDLAILDSVTIPQNGFEGSNELKVGTRKVINRFFGEAHSIDNIVSYFPSDKMLFGGCMVKEIGAGKGNLNDANINEWSKTISKIKKAYPDLEKVIPGHGKTGGIELLDYTIKKFKLVE